MSINTITLNVSGTRFCTRKSVLSISPYFHDILVLGNRSVDIQPDGSLYVDADPLTFLHLLNFMRRPSKFPLFWTGDKGFDYMLYSSLEKEADDFGLESLRDWIREGGYTKAIVTTVTTLPTNEGLGTGDVTVQHFNVHQGGNYFTCIDASWLPQGKTRCSHSTTWGNEPLNHERQWVGPQQSVLTVITKVALDRSALENLDYASKKVENGTVEIDTAAEATAYMRHSITK